MPGWSYFTDVKIRINSCIFSLAFLQVLNGRSRAHNRVVEGRSSLYYRAVRSDTKCSSVSKINLLLHLTKAFNNDYYQLSTREVII